MLLTASIAITRSLSKQDLFNGNMVRYESTGGQQVECVSNGCMVDESEIVKINVCGMIYETLERTLSKFPKTLLGDPQRRSKYYINSRKTYFFNRNIKSFEAILYFYQTNGILIRPPNVPMVLFAEEVSFYELGEDVFIKLQEDEGYIQDFERELPKHRWKRVIWNLFEYPDTSIIARAVAVWSVFVIILSITVFCLETIPSLNPTDKHVDQRFREPWFSFELACIGWFTFEYMMRLISSPKPWIFVRSFLNIIDLLAILPYFLTLTVNFGNSTPLSLLRVVRLIRVFRIFKLSRHSLGLRILGRTLRASVNELCMLIFFLMLGVILFSSAIFYAEQTENNLQFQSIPSAFWYSLITMTTVGYGDIIPKSVAGKLIGSMCAIVGVLMITLQMPIIVSNFEYFYKRDRMSYEKLMKGKMHTPETSNSGDNNIISMS